MPADRSAPPTRTALTPLDLAASAASLVAFIVLAFWGFVGWVFPWNIVVGFAAPLFALLAWALAVSSRAVFAVHPFLRAFVELTVYVAATIALWDMGLAWTGLGYGAAAVTIGVVVGRRRLS